MKQISLESLKSKITRGDQFILVNALDEHLFNKMHIPGSINISKIDDITRYLRKDDEIVVYCTDIYCNRSVTLYQFLLSMGYTRVRRFTGGLRAWVEAGYEVTRNIAWNIIPMYSRYILGKAQ